MQRLSKGCDEAAGRVSEGANPPHRDVTEALELLVQIAVPAHVAQPLPELPDRAGALRLALHHKRDS